MTTTRDCYYAEPGATICWVIEGDLAVIFVAKGEPIRDDIFGKFIRDLKTHNWTKGLGGTVGSIELTSVQRSQLADALKGKRIIGLTDNAVARGIATALGWFGLQTRACSWKNIDQAIDYLELNPQQAATVLALLQELREKST